MFKYAPAITGENRFRQLPSTYEILKLTGQSPLLGKPYTIAKANNLPNRHFGWER